MQLLQSRMCRSSRLKQQQPRQTVRGRGGQLFLRRRAGARLGGQRKTDLFLLFRINRAQFDFRRSGDGPVGTTNSGTSAFLLDRSGRDKGKATEPRIPFVAPHGEEATSRQLDITFGFYSLFG